MGTLNLVRHGQAAFGTARYDCLTDTGQRQARLLGEWFAARRLRFDAVFTGTLERQVDTARHILSAAPALGHDMPQERLRALNEYDPAAILRAHGGDVTWTPGDDGRGVTFTLRIPIRRRA